MKRSLRKSGEKSFTLLETIIALGLLVTVILEVTSVLGRSIDFSSYERKSTQAIWLGKSILAQIEYKSKFYPIKEITADIKDQEFDTELCPTDARYDCDYKFNLKIETWNLPLVDLLTGGMGLGGGADKTEEDNSGADEQKSSTMTSMIKDKLKEFLGDELIKTVDLEVYWGGQGAKKNSVSIAYLVTNQLAVDAQLETLEPVNKKDTGGKSDDNKVPSGKGKKRPGTGKEKSEGASAPVEGVPVSRPDVEGGG